MGVRQKVGQKVGQRHLLLRSGVYYFRWRLPADLRPILGATDLKRSLRTADHLRAVVRAAPLELAVTDIQRIRQAYFASELDSDEYTSSLKQHWKRVNSRMRKKGKIHLTRWMQKGDFAVDFGGDVEKELAAIADAQARGLIDSQAIQQPEQQQVEELKQHDMSSGMVFSELFAKFLNHKTDAKEMAKEKRKPLTDKMQKGYVRDFNTLVEIMGDLPIATITRKGMKDAILAFGSLPRRNKNPYKSLPVLELLEMEIPEEDLIADNTVSDVKKMAQGIFRFAIEEELIAVSPARDLNLSLDSSRTFAPYNYKEVLTILDASFNESVPWKKWLPTLAAYTGARRGELAQLRKQDIKFDTDSGRHYILITEDAGSVKTENATRQVPLHAALIGRNFLDFVDHVDGRLFGDLDPQAVTKWFMPFRDKLGIERFDDFGNRKVFHSFRHTFITRSRSVGNPVDHVQQVVGHEVTSAGVTDRYTHRQPLKAVLDVVDKVVYE